MTTPSEEMTFAGFARDLPAHACRVAQALGRCRRRHLRHIAAQIDVRLLNLRAEIFSDETPPESRRATYELHMPLRKARLTKASSGRGLRAYMRCARIRRRLLNILTIDDGRHILFHFSIYLPRLSDALILMGFFAI